MNQTDEAKRIARLRSEVKQKKAEIRSIYNQIDINRRATGPPETFRNWLPTLVQAAKRGRGYHETVQKMIEEAKAKGELHGRRDLLLSVGLLLIEAGPRKIYLDDEYVVEPSDSDSDDDAPSFPPDLCQDTLMSERSPKRARHR